MEVPTKTVLVAALAIVFSVVAFMAAGFASADNGSGNGKDCMNQTQVQTLVNQTVATQIQNITETTQNQTITQVIEIINQTVDDQNLQDQIVSNIENITQPTDTTVVNMTSTNSTDSNNFTMKTSGIPMGQYELYKNGQPYNHTLSVSVPGGVQAGEYSVTKH